MKVREKKNNNNSISETRGEERSSAFISSPTSKPPSSFFLSLFSSFSLPFFFHLPIPLSKFAIPRMTTDRHTVQDAIQLMDHKKPSRTVFHISNKTFVMKFPLFLCLVWDCIWLSFPLVRIFVLEFELCLLFRTDNFILCCLYLKKYRGMLYRYVGRVAQ